MHAYVNLKAPYLYYNQKAILQTYGADDILPPSLQSLYGILVLLYVVGAGQNDELFLKFFLLFAGKGKIGYVVGP